MAIDPKLVSIKTASELPTKTNPTANDEFLIYDGVTLKKSTWANVQALIESGSTSLGNITPSSTIPPSGNVWGFANAGTYPNAGGLVVTAGNMGVLSRVGGVWSKTEVAMPKGSDGKTFEYYSAAKSYVIGDSFIYGNEIYYVSAAGILGSDPLASNKVYKIGTYGENFARNNGVFANETLRDYGNLSIVNNEYLISGGGIAFIEIKPQAFNTYVTFTDAIKTGIPLVGYEIEGVKNVLGDFIPGKIYTFPPNVQNMLIYPNNGSVTIRKYHITKEPMLSVRDNIGSILNNYFLNPILNGYADKVGDRVRLIGDNTLKQIDFYFDHPNRAFFKGLKFLSTNNLVSITVALLNDGGGFVDTGIFNLMTTANKEHLFVGSRLGSYDKSIIRIKWTGQVGDTFDIYSPFITEREPSLNDFLMTTKSVSTSGIPKFDTVSDAVIDAPPALFQVGRNLLTKKIDVPILKTDYALVNGQPFAKNSKLTDLEFVDLGVWQLMLITTDKKFIFAKTGEMKYTYDLNSVLVPSAHDSEKRFTLNADALTPMFNIGAVAVREMGNKELVIINYGTSHHYTTENQTVLNVSGSHPTTIGSRLDGWAVDAYGDTFVFSTYSPAGDTGYGIGSVILSIDYGKTWTEIFNAVNWNYDLHIHGVFIDQYRDAIVMIFGDGDFSEIIKGKINVLYNYRTNTVWENIPFNFKEGPREQYCTGIALKDNVLFGTDMAETCVARMAVDTKGYNSPREWADQIMDSLSFVPNFTRPVEPNAPIGIHYSSVLGTNPSSIMLTKDGFNFAKIYTDAISNPPFANNNARVWCTVNGELYCTQFNGRFTNELVIGKYNGFNSI